MCRSRIRTPTAKFHPGGYRRQGRQYADRRRQPHAHGRPLLGGIRGAGGCHREGGQGQRRDDARGGAFKPRTSPYSFQGLGEVGLRYLEIAKEETGLPIVTELMDLSQLPLFKNVDVIQIGARNMQNFDL